MINSAEELGLRVESITPDPNMININVNNSISILFNEDISTSTIVGNVVVLLDTNYVFNGVTPITDLSLYTEVKCTMSYKNKTVIFTPESTLVENSRYLVYITKGNIKSIFGKVMITDYISTFYTESIATLPKCTFTSPSFGGITEVTPTFVWNDQASKCYMLQISSQPTFEVILYDSIIKSDDNDNAENECSPIRNFAEGLYYVRVKSINGMFSDPFQFFIKSATKGVVNIEDTPEDESIDELLRGGLEVIEIFPKENQVQIDTEVQIVYVKIKGKVELDDIDFKDCFIVGELIDDDEEDVDGISPHGNVDGTWSTVYDLLRNVTYIIFTPVTTY